MLGRLKSPPWAVGVTVAVGLAVAAGAGGCDRAPASSAGEVRVVATTTVLGSVVEQVVACAGGTTTVLMPVGADPHDFAPSSADITAMVKADLVVANGLGLEGGVADAITNAIHDGARILEVAPKLDPIPFDGHAGTGEDSTHPATTDPGHGESDHSHADGSLDPHVWLDAARMAKAATLIAGELGDITGDTATFQRCGAKIADMLNGVDTEVRTTLQAVPENRRVLITDHDAFGYFAAAYGFEVAGVVIPGGSTLATPSSAETANLVGVIRARGVPVIFSNTTVPYDLAATVAKEAGADVKVVPLYVGSLGTSGSGAETYQALMRTDATRIAQALAA